MYIQETKTDINRSTSTKLITLTEGETVQLQNTWFIIISKQKVTIISVKTDS